MEFGWSDEEVAYRAALASFLDEELASGRHSLGVSGVESRRSAGRSKEFAATLAEKGWLVPHWPTEYGGNDTPPWHHIILGEEMWSRGEPRGPQYMNVNWIGPTIMKYGTDEQKAYHLGRIAAGDVIYCQGFSEPDAGSDLASMRTSAVRDGDEYVVNGQKTWCSYANSAEFCFLLVRTDNTGGKQHGISILLVPTDTPGFEVIHLKSIVGDHALHDLFFTDMRVPMSCRLGPENEGWDIVRGALGFERVGSPRYGRAEFMLDQIVQWAADNDRLDDQSVIERIALARAQCEAARYLVYCVIQDRVKGRTPGVNASAGRYAMVTADRYVGDLALDLMGEEGLEIASLADEQFRSALPSGVAGGTLEVQLTLVAKQALGLGGK